jgi:hypothetical protein
MRMPLPVHRRLLVCVGLALAATAPTNRANAQAVQEGKTKKESKVKAPKDKRDSSHFFDVEEPLELTLTTNLRQLRRDKSAEAPWRAATLSYAGDDGKTLSVPLKVRTRGIWRLKNCDFPPLRLNFVKDSVKHTLFAKQDKPKLVTHCRANDEFEQYVLQEFQLYRVYRLLTPYSHKARLARMTYVDSATSAPQATRYGLIVEDVDELAERVGARNLDQKGAGPDDADAFQQTLFSVFQYLIGNTDWSIAGLHNVEILGVDTAVVPVAYDFDFAGAVDARYASVDPRLPVKKVRDRLYRGYCTTPDQYAAVFALFNDRKEAILGLYRDRLGTLLKPDVARETLAYFEEFYKTINDPRRAKYAIVDACLR